MKIKTKQQYRYQIDQSGKIEQTNKDTVLCLANGNCYTVLIKAKTKRQLQEIFRRNGQPRNYVLFTFSAGIYLLLNNYTALGAVTIDREYFGREAIIKKIILEMFGKDHNKIIIGFSTIGKRVNAHLEGYKVFKGKIEAGQTLNQKNLIKAIKKTEVGKQLKDT